MMLINGISLLILGIFTVPTLFLPDKWAIKISPYKKQVGIIYLVLGILEITLCLINPGWLALSLFVRIITLVCAVDKITVGFMLGRNIIARIFNKNDNKKITKENIDYINFKTTLGIISIGLGFCLIALYILL